MKRIAIFCDGTWNRSDRVRSEAEGRFLTNIVHLREAVIEGRAPDGVEQRVFYIDGVGTPEDVGWLRSATDKYLGGTFGWGLDDKILKAYRLLCEHYRPGDDIHVFGFSRGAYTARSLVGLLRNCSLPAAPDPALFDHLMAIYRSRRGEDVPWSERTRRLREWVNPRLVSHAEDLADHPAADQCTVLRVKYLGVYDTVGALGLPELWPGLARANARYKFHDTVLSSMVDSARQVIAIDDPRITFRPVPWEPERLRALNAAPGAAGRYRQEWFPGLHGTVGGALPAGHDGLGLVTLDWMAAGAEAAGLAFDPVRRAHWAEARDPSGPFREPGARHSLVDRLTIRYFPYRRPEVPEAGAISRAAAARWQDGRSGEGWPYRPPQLGKLAAALGWPG